MTSRQVHGDGYLEVWSDVIETGSIGVVGEAASLRRRGFHIAPGVHEGRELKLLNSTDQSIPYIRIRKYAFGPKV